MGEERSYATITCETNNTNLQEQRVTVSQRMRNETKAAPTSFNLPRPIFLKKS